MIGLMMSRSIHLAKRFVLSLVPSQVQEIERQWVRSILSQGEFDMWNNMMVQDQRHSVVVARRFVMHRPTAVQSEIAGALLHDVGKSAARLGTVARVIATLVGPRTSRFRQYHDHENIGATMLRSIGSDEMTISMVEGSCGAELQEALNKADDI
ncbi:MAG: HDIG domain-containing protein [Actinobacteria bacterium]|nr:MAG: HDIG domain-containing protein [Actinomycetota bacterium]